MRIKSMRVWELANVKFIAVKYEDGSKEQWIVDREGRSERPG